MRVDNLDYARLQERKRNESDMRSKLADFNESSFVFEKIIRELVDEYCGGLTEFSRDIDEIIQGIKRGQIGYYSELKLEIRALELANAMYKATEGLAVFGGKTDIAKLKREELFNQKYKNYTGTIPERKAKAESELLHEKTLERIFDRCYTIASQKIKSANRVLEAIKKIITSRMIHLEVFRKESPTMDRIGDTEYDTDSFNSLEEGEDLDV